MQTNGLDLKLKACSSLKLYKLSERRIIPFIRPYRVYRDRFTWHSDPSIIEYIQQQLDKGIYQGFGEFHLFKEHKDSAVVKALMDMAVERQLAVSAHADAETIEYLIQQHPKMKLIWAHCGMDHPVQDVKRILDRYPAIHCD